MFCVVKSAPPSQFVVGARSIIVLDVLTPMLWGIIIIIMIMIILFVRQLRSDMH